VSSHRAWREGPQIGGVRQSPVRLGWQHPRDRNWSSPARPLLVRKSNSGFLLACSCVASLSQLWNDRAHEFLLLRERWLWYTSTQSIHLERREAWSAGPGAFACTRIRVCARASPGSSEPHHTPAAPIEQLSLRMYWPRAGRRPGDRSNGVRGEVRGDDGEHLGRKKGNCWYASREEQVEQYQPTVRQQRANRQ
jgi:hypothetical protein